VLIPGLVALACLFVVSTILWLRARGALQKSQARLRGAAQGLEQLQRAFSRFAPAAVVEQIARQGISLRSVKKEVTVLFADVKGFTRLSERLDAEELVDLLNGYFRAMSRAITDHGGHVAKLIGDGMLALFGALEPNPWQANDAVHAALAMRAALADYNASLAASGRPTLGMGIGIHRGTAVAGVIGSEELLDYTVIGSTVNLSSRVESLTRVHEVDVLITEAVHATLDPRFRRHRLPPVEVKGVSEPVPTWVVEGFSDAAAAADAVAKAPP
jgi:adenylate cyclase